MEYAGRGGSVSRTRVASSCTSDEHGSSARAACRPVACCGGQRGPGGGGGGAATPGAKGSSDQHHSACKSSTTKVVRLTKPRSSHIGTPCAKVSRSSAISRVMGAASPNAPGAAGGGGGASHDEGMMWTPAVSSGESEPARRFASVRARLLPPSSEPPRVAVPAEASTTKRTTLSMDTSLLRIVLAGMDSATVSGWRGCTWFRGEKGGAKREREWCVVGG